MTPKNHKAKLIITQGWKALRLDKIKHPFQGLCIYHLDSHVQKLEPQEWSSFKPIEIDLPDMVRRYQVDLDGQTFLLWDNNGNYLYFPAGIVPMKPLREFEKSLGYYTEFWQEWELFDHPTLICHELLRTEINEAAKQNAMELISEIYLKERSILELRERLRELDPEGKLERKFNKGLEKLSGERPRRLLLDKGWLDDLAQAKTARVKP